MQGRSCYFLGGAFVAPAFFWDFCLPVFAVAFLALGRSSLYVVADFLGLYPELPEDFLDHLVLRKRVQEMLGIYFRSAEPGSDFRRLLNGSLGWL